MRFEDDRNFAEDLDRQDPLAGWREKFNFPLERNGYSPVYLCGNSLGLQPQRAVDFVEQELAAWRDLDFTLGPAFAEDALTDPNYAGLTSLSTDTFAPTARGCPTTVARRRASPS